MLDVFKTDAFGVIALTDTINKLKYVPGRLAERGIFTETSVATTSVMIEEKDGVLKLIAPTPRGGPGTTLEKPKRSARSLVVPHFEINDAIMAEEVQGVRAFGSENQFDAVFAKVAERGGFHSQSMDATEEYSRMGALKGIVTYADGSTLNLFTEFGVTQIAEVDFDLDNASPASGALRKKCATVVRQIVDELGGVPLAGVGAMCSDEFFDDLMAHPEVVESYKGTAMAAVLREGYVVPGIGRIYGAFEFGGIVWENYRGSVDGTSFIAADKAHIFPLGVPGLFRTVYAPADYIETVNTLGRRLYTKQYEMPNGKGVHFDTQMNSLNYCVRPRTLIKAKRT